MQINLLTIGIIAACIGIMGSLWGGFAFFLVLLLLVFFQNKDRKRNQKWTHSDSYKDKIVEADFRQEKNIEIEKYLETEKPTEIIEKNDLTAKNISLKIKFSKNINSNNTEFKEQTELQKIINKNTGVFRDTENPNVFSNTTKSPDKTNNNSTQSITTVSFQYLRTAKALSIQRGWTIKLEANVVIIVKGKRKFFARNNEELMSFF
jgi:hypothetical protein